MDTLTALAPVLHGRVAEWYDEHARDLPWRRPEATPWGVLVSELMLQQTPVSRVLPAWEAWMEAWPTPDDLVAAGPGAAVRAWGRLGYPRRALRLHAAAAVIVEVHGGRVPEEHADLLALPGVGEYTAAAVASFAYHQRHAVLDTNVRRVLARVVGGVAAAPASLTRGERERAGALLPSTGAESAAWAVGAMELGALVCTVASPGCARCPVEDLCAWRAADHPPDAGPPRRVQQYAGTDRQCRGRLLEVLRSSEGPVHRTRLEAAWAPADQRERCLESLVTDGLAVLVAGAGYALP